MARQKKRKRVAQQVRVLRDLPNTDGDVRAAVCHSRSQAEDFLRQREAVCAYGSRGWLRVWCDDEGWWQCQLKIGDGETLAAALFRHVAAAAAWIDEQWPKLDR